MSACAAIATSFSTQNPAPPSGPAWCEPPAMLQATPCSSASRAASSVPADDRKARRATAAVFGSPISRSSAAVSAWFATRST